jgi:hypothetical protein
MHVGAPPHSALGVRAWLNQKFPGCWLGRRGPHEWPARSPDLTLCDFFLWGWAKEEVYRAKSHTLEQLEDRIRQVITNVPHDFLQKRSFEEDGGCCRCLRWILSFASIFPFKKVHVKIILFIFALEITSYDHFSMPTYFPTTMYLVMLVLIMLMLLILSVICALIMMFIRHWRIFVLIQLVMNWME